MLGILNRVLRKRVDGKKLKILTPLSCVKIQKKYTYPNPPPARPLPQWLLVTIVMTSKHSGGASWKHRCDDHFTLPVQKHIVASFMGVENLSRQFQTS